MFGLSYFFQYAVLGLMFYLGAVYANRFSVNPGDSLAAILLLIGACFAAANNVYYIEDLSTARNAITDLFSIIDMEDEHQLWAKGRTNLLK